MRMKHSIWHFSSFIWKISWFFRSHFMSEPVSHYFLHTATSRVPICFPSTISLFSYILNSFTRVLNSKWTTFQNDPNNIRLLFLNYFPKGISVSILVKYGTHRVKHLNICRCPIRVENYDLRRKDGATKKNKIYFFCQRDTIRVCVNRRDIHMYRPAYLSGLEDKCLRTDFRWECFTSFYSHILPSHWLCYNFGRK